MCESISAASKGMFDRASCLLSILVTIASVGGFRRAHQPPANGAALANAGGEERKCVLQAEQTGRHKNKNSFSSAYY